MELLRFINPSLDADYGTFECEVCGTEFNYSPRLDTCCNRCALDKLTGMLFQTPDIELRHYIDEARQLLLECQHYGSPQLRTLYRSQYMF